MEIVQTIMIALAAGAAIWYAYDNAQIRKIMAQQAVGNRPELVISLASNIIEIPVDGFGKIPDEAVIHVTNVGPANAIRILINMIVNWDNKPITKRLPQLKSDATCDLVRIDHAAKSIEGYLKKSKELNIGIHIEIGYEDMYGFKYKYTGTQKYEPQSGSWIICNEHIQRTN